MKICIVSDIHFKYVVRTPEDRENAALVLDFFRSCIGKYDLLVLNGDIFDLWFDWQFTIVKQYFPLLHLLAAIRENGCRIVLISGNHDFWFGDFLPRTMGIEVYPDAFEFAADGKQIVCEHGDRHTSNDFRYQLFRRLIRLNWVRKLFSVLHPDFALQLSNRLSRSSRDRKIDSRLKARKALGLESYARRRLAQSDIVVLGHSHEPSLKAIGKGFYANSGDWVSHHSYLEIIDGNPVLAYYKSDKE